MYSKHKIIGNFAYILMYTYKVMYRNLWETYNLMYGTPPQPIN